MAVERVIFETETDNVQGGKFYSDVLTTGGDVEDVSSDDRVAVNIDPGVQAVRIRIPWTPGVDDALKRGRTFRLRGDRFKTRSSDRDGDNASVLVLGERLA